MIETITDFDFGVGSSNEVVRVSNIPQDVTDSEVNLILWLVLEHELGSLDRVAISRSRTQSDGGTANLNDISEDSVDAGAANISQLSGGGDTIQYGAVLSARTRRKSVSQSGRARRYAEELLRQSGINMPFNELSFGERRDLFQQFSSSSQLLRGQKFGSILELFEALRARSRFREEFDVLQRVGRGNFGDVFAVSHRDSMNQYAAKRIALTIDSIEEMRMTLNESKILKSLKHPHIVRCHDAWLEMQYDPEVSVSEDEQQPLKFYVLMDNCHQSLFQWIDEVRTKPSEHQVMLILKQMLAGLEFIHSNRILHLDINTKNVLWADPQRSGIKIGDFGLAIKGDHFADKTGTFPYYAPDSVFTIKSDVYSLGVTIFEVAENISTMNELHERICKNDIQTQLPFLNNMLPRLLEKAPNLRPTATQAKMILNSHI